MPLTTSQHKPSPVIPLTPRHSLNDVYGLMLGHPCKEVRKYQTLLCRSYFQIYESEEEF